MLRASDDESHVITFLTPVFYAVHLDRLIALRPDSILIRGLQQGEACNRFGLSAAVRSRASFGLLLHGKAWIRSPKTRLTEAGPYVVEAVLSFRLFGTFPPA